MTRVQQKLNQRVKKMPVNVDNLSANEKKRLELLTNIQKMVSENYSREDIAEALGISTRTVTRYRDCNPVERCRLKRPSRTKEISSYREKIIALIREGYHASGIAATLKESGCTLGICTIRKYVNQLAEELELPLNKHRKGPDAQSQKEFRESISSSIRVKKQDITQFIWMNKSLEGIKADCLYQQYPQVYKLKVCVDEFRQIFLCKSMPRLYLFIERYSKSEFAPIASFAKGLLRDIEAVENAVASPLSNGFVEGINNRTKMIKRDMYGRCGLELLAAKIMLPYVKTDN